MGAHSDGTGGNSSSGAFSSRSRIPQRLGRFEVRDRLGAGGFGAVYRAYDPQLQRDVALKLLHITGDEQRDRQRIERFLIEGRASARLQHPHIVPVFDAGQDDETGEYYQAAAFIDGRTLAAEIDDQPLEFRRAAVIVRKLAQALGYAHSEGILHRDVKPENVMLDRKDEPHLMDFGLARIEESDEKLTREGAVMGTAAYMSPEQAKGQQDQLTPASDQYSLGIVLYELLTGQTPFSGPPHVQIHHHLHTEPAAPGSENPAVPRDLETICLKALSKEPARRYASCADFAADLQRWLEDEPITARPIGPLERLYRWSRRNPLIAGLGGAVAALLLLLSTAGPVMVARETFARQQAERERMRAEELAVDERAARDVLQQQQQQLIEGREFAEERRIEAVRRRNEALRYAYSGILHNAQDACSAFQFERFRTLLEQAVPQSSEPDLRGWEWYFLNCVHGEAPAFKCAGRGSPKWSPDGRWLAHIHESSIVIRDSRTFDTVNRLPEANWFDWSPDSNHIAVRTSNAREVAIFDVASGEVQQTLKTEQSASGLNSSASDLLVWSSDGKLIASATGGYDRSRRSYWGELRLVNVETAEVVVRKDWPDRAPGTLQWAADSQRLGISFNSSSGALNSVQWLDPSTGETVGEFTPSMSRPNYADWNSTGDIVALSSSSGGSSEIWKADGSERLAASGSSRSIRWSKTGPFLSQSRYRTLSVWNFDEQTRRTSLWGHNLYAHNIDGGTDWHPSRPLLATYLSTDDGPHIAVWDMTQAIPHCSEFIHRPLRSVPKSTPREIVDVAWRPGGHQLLAIDADGRVLLLAGDSGYSARPHSLPGNIRHAVWNHDGTRLFLVDREGRLTCWELDADLQQIAPCWEHPDPVQFVLPTQRGLLVGTGPAGQVALCDPTDGTRQQTFDAGSGLTELASYSPVRDECAFVRGDEITMLRWNAGGEGEWQTANIRRGEGEERSIDAGLNYSPDGRWLAAASSAGTVLILSTDTWEIAQTLASHQNGITGIAWSPDGKRLASGDGNGVVRIWDPVIGSEVLSVSESLWTGNHGRSYARFRPTKVAWDSSGRNLAAAGMIEGWLGFRYGTVQVWSAVGSF